MAKTIDSPRPRRRTADHPRPEPGPASTPPEVVDVWSRTGSKYRIRATVLLAINVLLFAGVGSFAFWLRSGEVFAPAIDGYADELAQTFKFGGRPVVSLASFLLEPINVQEVPMQIPIVGLLMAALIAIPILISILYRFWSSLPFIAVVGFLAVMPWLAITLLGSCIIASVRPFKSRFRFMAALLGLLPAVAYLMGAWKGTAEAVAGRADPIDLIKFVAPWVLAIVAAALLFAIVLTIAKVVNYRPGAITPLLAVMFGLPVALFEFHVGRDELHYRLLEALNEEHFADVDASLDLKEAVWRAWARHPLPRPRWEEIAEIEEQMWQFELAADMGPRRSQLARHQAELVRRCDWFHEQFPTSRYVLNALFIKARALDMRVDAAEFRRTKWIRFYDDFPSRASRETWEVIAENDPESILGTVASIRLAQLDARARDVERAIHKLERVLVTSPPQDGPPKEELPPETGLLEGMLAPELPEADLAAAYRRIRLEAHQLYELLAKNNDPLYGYDPFSRPRRRDSAIWFGLMDLDPRHEHYIDNLRLLRAAYPNCQLEDNIVLEIAKATSSLPLKIERLEECLRDFPTRDAASEALFRLGVAYQAAGQSSQSRAAFARLVTDYPNSLWARHGTRYTAVSPPIHLTEGSS